MIDDSLNEINKLIELAEVISEGIEKMSMELNRKIALTLIPVTLLSFMSIFISFKSFEIGKEMAVGFRFTMEGLNINVIILIISISISFFLMYFLFFILTSINQLKRKIKSEKLALLELTSIIDSIISESETKNQLPIVSRIALKFRISRITHLY